MQNNAEYHIIWEFTVTHNRLAEFEEAYGPSGPWVVLFRKCEGYLGTQLLRDLEREGVYVTVDRWMSQDAFVQFQRQFETEYRALDEQLEGIAGSERRIGVYKPLPT